MTFNISTFKGYLSVWTDNEEAMRRLNPRLLNGKPASYVVYENGKARCAFKAGLISLLGKDFFVRVTDDSKSWVMMPSTPKKVTKKVAKKVVNANTTVEANTPVAESQKIALAVAKKVANGQVTLL